MNILRHISFMLLGVLTFYNAQDPYNYGVVITGVVLGFLYSFLCKGFIHRTLRLLNGKIKKEAGKEPIRKAIEMGGLFIIPFALMGALSTLWFGWQLSASFVTTGVMAIGTASSMEFAKLTGRPMIKNTLATTVLAWCFSTLWTMGIPFLKHMPGLLEGGIAFARSLMGGL